MAHFIFQKLDAEGSAISLPINVKSDTGIILQCPPLMDHSDIRHLCAIARHTPNYPVDLTLWEGPRNARYLTWSARIMYFNGETGEHRIRRQAE